MKNLAIPCSPGRADTIQDGANGCIESAPALIPQPDNPERDHSMPFTLQPDDELIARLLIHTWTLTTGKTLRCNVPPHELTEEELIDFWSDDRFD
jgi:hypothetical protein